MWNHEKHGQGLPSSARRYRYHHALATRKSKGAMSRSNFDNRRRQARTIAYVVAYHVEDSPRSFVIAPARGCKLRRVRRGNKPTDTVWSRTWTRTPRRYRRQTSCSEGTLQSARYLLESTTTNATAPHIIRPGHGRVGCCGDAIVACTNEPTTGSECRERSSRYLVEPKPKVRAESKTTPSSCIQQVENTGSSTW